MAEVQPEIVEATYEDIQSICMGMAEEIRSWGIEEIVAVTNGGLFPAGFLAKAMPEIKVVKTVCTRGYDKQNGGLIDTQLDRQEHYYIPDLASPDGEGAFLIDEVLDTGRTLQTLSELWPKAHIGVVYTKFDKSETLNRVDVFGKEIGQVWIDLPWDRDQRQLGAAAVLSTRKGHSLEKN